MWGSEPSSLFRWLVSLWIIQDSRRHCLEGWEQVAITRAPVHSINGMASRVCVYVLLGLRRLGHHYKLLLVFLDALDFGPAYTLYWPFH